MKIKKAVIWCLITRNLNHPALTNELSKENLKPLISTLFPGAEYDVPGAFAALRIMYGIPALETMFPEIKEIAGNSIGPEEMVEIKSFLPSDGYQWQTDPNWREEFNMLVNQTV